VHTRPCVGLFYSCLSSLMDRVTQYLPGYNNLHPRGTPSELTIILQAPFSQWKLKATPQQLHAGGITFGKIPCTRFIYSCKYSDLRIPVRTTEKIWTSTPNKVGVI
jgi:hypothetical protein